MSFYKGNYGAALGRIDTSPITQAGQAWGETFRQLWGVVAESLEKSRKKAEEKKEQQQQAELYEGMLTANPELAKQFDVRPGEEKTASLALAKNPGTMQAISGALNQKSLMDARNLATKQSEELFGTQKQLAQAQTTIAQNDAKFAETFSKLDEAIKRNDLDRMKEVLANLKDELAQSRAYTEAMGGQPGLAQHTAAMARLELNQGQAELAGTQARTKATEQATARQARADSIVQDAALVTFSDDGAPQLPDKLYSETYSPEYRAQVLAEADMRNSEKTMRDLKAKGQQASMKYTEAMTRYQDHLRTKQATASSTEFERYLSEALEKDFIDEGQYKEFMLGRLAEGSGVPQGATAKEKLKYAGEKLVAPGLTLRQLMDTKALAESGGSDTAKIITKNGQKFLEYKYIAGDKQKTGKVPLTEDLDTQLEAFEKLEKSFMKSGVSMSSQKTLGGIELTPESIQNSTSGM